MDVKIKLTTRGLNSGDTLADVEGFVTITTQPADEDTLFSQQKIKMDYSPDTGILSETVPSGAVVELFVPMSDFTESKTIPSGDAEIFWVDITA